MRRVVALLAVLMLATTGCGDDADSSDTDPTMTWTGSGCVYEGPIEFDVGTALVVSFINASDAATFEEANIGFNYWAVPDGTTAEDIRDKGIFNLGGKSMATGSMTPVSDTESQFTFPLDEQRLYALNCAHRPPDGPDADYATIITTT